jgi:hypothetical protein
MKQIFEILQEERDRILGIHESATKNQYLNVILNEQEAYNRAGDKLYRTIVNETNTESPEGA